MGEGVPGPLGATWSPRSKLYSGKDARMDLTQIKYLLAFAGTLNFTRAAQACNVRQPAPTKSVEKLEDELGGPLLL